MGGWKEIYRRMEGGEIIRIWDLGFERRGEEIWGME